MGEVTCYGGVGEIGGNKLLLEVGEASVLLDFGFSFGAEGQFFEEYLQPRTGSKLHDLLRLGLLPRIDGIYRRDALQPEGLDDVDGTPTAPFWDADVRSYEAAQDRGEWTPDAVFVSHAHLDHVGYLGYLGDVPLLCSPATETVMGVIGAVGNLSGFDAELLERRRRYVDTYDGGYFPGEPTVRKHDAEPRDTRVREPGVSEPIQGTEVTLEAFDVGHSIPGALAALVESGDRQVVYTGDIRFHGRGGVDLGEELRGLRPDLMLCEGTRIDEDDPDDERGVEDDLAGVFREAEGLAMVGFGWKDLERYETVRLAADRAGRTAVVDPRLAYLKARLGGSVYDDGASVFVERTDSMLYSPGDYTRAKHKAGDGVLDEWDPSEGAVDTTHLDEGVTARDLRNAPHEYVLHLGFYRFGNLVDIEPPPGSVYVRARTEPFNDEMVLSEDRLTNWLEHFGVNAAEGHEPIQVHASGHASGPELQAMIDAIEPATLVPIHTEHPGAFENPAGRIVAPEEGTPIAY